MELIKNGLSYQCLHFVDFGCYGHLDLGFQTIQICSPVIHSPKFFPAQNALPVFRSIFFPSIARECWSVHIV